jgi:hypothetical protein
VAHTYESLKALTLAELRQIAKELTSEHVQGYSQMNKERLLPALCQALGIDALHHQHVTGIDKAAIKAKMRELKKQRDVALDEHDHAALSSIRRQLHHLNHQIRAHMS